MWTLHPFHTERFKGRLPGNIWTSQHFPSLAALWLVFLFFCFHCIVPSNVHFASLSHSNYRFRAHTSSLKQKSKKKNFCASVCQFHLITTYAVSIPVDLLASRMSESSRQVSLRLGSELRLTLIAVPLTFDRWLQGHPSHRVGKGRMSLTT